MAEPIPHAVRPADDGDRAFIYATWMRSARGTTPLRELPDKLYHHDRVGYRRCVEGYLERGTTLVACDAAEPDVVYAWACAEGGVLHGVYTRYPFRRRGLATRLLDDLGVWERTHPVATCELPAWWQWRNWEHDPLAAPILGHEYRSWLIGWRTAFGEVRIVGR